VDWLRWELGSVITFHIGFGVVILLAPDNLIVTPATWPVFFYTGRIGMGAAFLIVGAFACACWYRARPLVQLATWLGVVMLGAGWLAGFVIALVQNAGGLYGVIIWSVLLSLWTSTGVRLGLGNGGTGVAGHQRSSRRGAR
jgi:hypothetical protein